jgi:hypothetical protein
MAGDEFTLYFCDNTKKRLEEKYLGKLRYNSLNKFSFQRFKYKGSNSFYEIEERMSDGQIIYNVFTLETINDVRSLLLDNPLSEGEKEAYEDINDIIYWIDLIMKKYNNFFYSEQLEEGSIHLLLSIDVD